MSEIDDIFSSKKRPLPVDTSTNLPGLSKRRKKNSIPSKPTKSKKRHEPTDFGDSTSEKRLFETVVYTSADLPGPSRNRKKNSIYSKPTKSKKSRKPTDFGDSTSEKHPFETVVYTPVDLPGPSKRQKKDFFPNKNNKPTSKKNCEPTAFEDSRGSGDRKSNHLTFWS